MIKMVEMASALMGLALNPYNSKRGVSIDMNKKLDVPTAYKEPEPVLHAFTVHGVEVWAKSRKDALRMGNRTL